MTEDEWLATIDPVPLLKFLRHQTSSRKLRLFACAWARFNWRAPNAARQKAVETGERYADGQAARAELAAAYQAVQGGPEARFERLRRLIPPTGASAAAAFFRPRSSEIQMAFTAAAGALYNPRLSPQPAGQKRCQLIREIFGNPFGFVTLSADCVNWSAAPILKLAETIYTERAFVNLPILADALEEAGCADAAILEHCRGPGPHVRGCWVIDLLLEKE